MPPTAPKYPDLPLVPAPSAFSGPTDRAKKLLKQVCDKAIKDGDFSITRSPLPCPIDKNEFFALKPYFWEAQPGCWERRDGQRNPMCDKPQCQKQLQGMALAVAALAAGAKNVDPAYAATADTLLKVFFLDPETKMNPEVKYAQVNMGDCPMKGDKTFVVATRYLILVSQALPLLPPSPVVDGVKAWIQQQVQWMETSEQGAAARASGNNITMWYHAIYASHLGALDPARAAEYAAQVMSSYAALTPAQVLDEELKRTKPRHYTLFALESLFEIATVAGGGANPPPPAIIVTLNGLVEFARTVQPGQLDCESDNDARYGPKLAWFQRVLDRWEGKAVSDEDPDGSAWEGGWNQRTRLAWALI